jgi:hypothetical protein
MRSLTFVALVLYANFAHATWFADSNTGCSVKISSTEPVEAVHWSGPCVNGKAEGEGVLTASNGTFLRGEFRNGEAYQARGRELLEFKKGYKFIVGASYTKGESLQYSLPHTTSDKRSTPTNTSAIVGKWEWHPNDAVCPEIHEYFASGLRVLHNGEERVESAYSVFQLVGEQNIIRVLHTSISREGRATCVTDDSPIGSSFYIYLHFEDHDHFIACSSSDRSECFGRAFRLIQ